MEDETTSDRFNEICAMAWERHQFNKADFTNEVAKQIVTSGDRELMRHAVFLGASVQHEAFARQENDRLLRLNAEKSTNVIPMLADGAQSAAEIAAERQMAAFRRKNDSRDSVFMWRWGEGSTPLGEMTRELMLKIADAEEKKAKNVLTKCTFLRSIAALVPEGAKVQEALSEQQVVEIRDQVFGKESAA